LMRARPTTQEKRLRKRRELDALVKDVGSHHGRRRGGRGNSGQELLSGSKDCSSSDGSSIGEDRRQERLGIAVWRGGSGRQYFTLWWGLKWGLGASTVFLLASITIWLHINTRAELDVVRRHIVRVDDDAKSVPESLEQIGSRLRALESNQTSMSGQLARISSSVTKIMTRLDEVNASLAEGGENPLRLSQDVAEIRQGVGEVTKQLKIVANRSTGNSEGIAMINKELNTLKLNEIDMKNGREMFTSQKTKNLSNLEEKVKSLDSKVEEQTHQLDSFNMSIFDIERNTSAQLELEHKDIVTLAGKVASLQDDNLNVSSSLASLSVRCSNEITALLTNLTDLHKKIGAVEALQSRLEASGEESSVQNMQAMHAKNENSSDANVDVNSGTQKNLDRTEHEDEINLQDT